MDLWPVAFFLAGILDGFLHAFPADREVDPAILRECFGRERPENTAQVVVHSEGDELALRVKVGLQIGTSVKPRESFAEIDQVVGEQAGERVAPATDCLARRG